MRTAKVITQALITYAAKKKIGLIFVKQPKDGRESAFWYNGLLAELTYNDRKIHISASGAVNAELYGEDGEVICDSKYNREYFMRKISSIASTDEDLDDMELSGALTFQARNVWLVSVKIGDKFVAASGTNGSYRNAIADVIDNIDNIIAEADRRNSKNKKTEDKSLFEYAKKANCKLRLHQKPQGGKKDSLWYGGLFATVKYKDIVLEISAYGIVDVDLLDEDGEVLVSFKDKNNAGRFDEEMSLYIKDDDDLTSLEEEGRLIVNYNNWWEITARDKDGTFRDLEWVAEGYSYEDAIKEAIDGIKDVYCRLNEA